MNRVYIRRQGRMTKAQRHALETHFQRYAFTIPEAGDWHAAFGRRAPLVLEIGFGMGQGLAAFALQHPGLDCIGAEVYRPGIGSLLAILARENVANVRIFEGDARELVAKAPNETFTRIMIYFPDPWPKKRHHKRRLIDAAFVAEAARALTAEGELHLATDWQPYATAMLEVLDAEPSLANAAGDSAFSSRPDDRPLTRFEDRGRRLGHGVWDLIYKKAATTESR